MMNLGTFVVAAILVVIVAAIIASWVKAHREGRHISCDECGGCDAHGGNGSCGCADLMVEHMDEALKGKHA